MSLHPSTNARMIYDSRQLERLVSAVSQQVATVVLGRELQATELASVVARVTSDVAEIPTETLTPPQVAKRLRVSADKVLAWIRSGELRAVNVASPDAKRPRYRVTTEDLAYFENLRAVRDQVRPSSRHRSHDPGVKQFF